ncbi:MAG: DUF1549 domain-containing protein, partial [Planctomycetales bacterium]
DMLPGATQSQRIATGFHRNSMQALGNNPRKEEFRVKGIVDRLDVMGQVWLGLTLGCAECHNHKYDPLSQEEYYRLFAIFNNIPHYGEGFGIHGPRMLVLPETRNTHRETADVAGRLVVLRGELRRQMKPAKDKESDVARWRFDGDLADRSFEPATLTPSENKTSFVADSPDGTTKSLALEQGGFLRAAASSKLNVNGSLAISAWIKTRTSVGNIVSKYDWKSGQRSFVFGLGGEGEKSGRPGTLFAWVSATAEKWQGVEIHGSRPINDGTWRHVALAFEPNKSVRLYVDGVLDGKARILGNPPSPVAISARDLVVGAGYRQSKTPNAFFFEGRIADLRVGSRLNWAGRDEIKRIHVAMAALRDPDPPPEKLTMDGHMTAQVMVE